MQTDIFVKLMNFARNIGADVVFMPMKSDAKGLMTTVEKQHTAEEMDILLRLAGENNIRVGFAALPVSKGRIKQTKEGVRIGIRIGMEFDEYVYTLAHELAHYFLHYDKGDTITSEKHAEYEEQADRAAKMLLAAIAVDPEGGAS